MSFDERLRTAQDIRVLVDSLRPQPEVTSERAQFDAWASKALAVADDIDPMHCSLQQILGTLGTPHVEP